MWARRWLHHRKACRRSSIHPASLFASQAPLPTISPMGCRCERWKMDLQRILWDGIGGDEKTPATGGRGAAEGGRYRKHESPCSSLVGSHAFKSQSYCFGVSFHRSIYLSSQTRWFSGSTNIRVFLVFVPHTHIFPKRVTLQTQVRNGYYIRIIQWKAKLLKKNKITLDW